MKAILKFDLPEEQEEFVAASNVTNYVAALWDFDQWLRAEYKYRDHETIDTWDCREKLREICLDNGVSMDGVILKTKKPRLMSRIYKTLNK